MQLHNVFVKRHDGARGKPQMFALPFEPLRPDLDIVEAAKQAVETYTATTEGQNVLGYNSGHFNWLDVWLHVPDAICEAHGFRKHGEIVPTAVVALENNLYRHSDTDRARFERLKAAILKDERDAAATFLSAPVPADEPDNVTAARMDNAWLDMSAIRLDMYYERYGID